MTNILALLADFPEADRNKILEAFQEQQARRPPGVPEAAQEGMALAPAWTPPLAERAQFPTGGEDVVEVFERARGQGLCLREATGNDPAAWTYWMTAPARAEVINRASDDPARGLPHLRRQLVRIADGLRKAHDAKVEVPEPVAVWGELAALAGPEGADPGLVEGLLRAHVLEPLDPGVAATAPPDQTARTAGQVLRWIEAARSLQPLLGPAFSAVVERASRRLALFARRLDDLNRLRPFLERPEQTAAFNALIEGDDKQWALHYCGDAGVGKTMFLRYLNARLGPARGLATVRIDFDDLDPDYPRHTPALLLECLADDLRLQDETVPQTSFSHFDDKVRVLNTRRGGSTAPPLVGVEAIRDPEFQGLLSTFADALRPLGHPGKPVVLLLDTCEELDRLREDGTLPDSVTATFEILEGLQKQLSYLRVVFSGRRPLASRGAGWSYGSKAPSALPKREYLRLHEVRGFTRGEAEQFLARFRASSEEEARRRLIPGDNPLPAEDLWKLQAGAIIRRSQFNETPDRLAGEPPENLFIYDPGRHPPAAGDRYNPFELDRFASWVRDDPKMRPEEIRDASPAEYVEKRILGRLKYPPLRDLIPVVALLGRFDRDLLQSATNSASFPQAFEELRNQEWIELKGPFLEVKPGLRKDLEAYYRQPEKAGLLAGPRRRAADYLERFTADDGAWDRLNVRHLDVTLRLLEELDPGRAADWWQQFEARIAARRAYVRARAWTDQLLGPDGAAAARAEGASGLPESRLRAAVLATRAAALLHTGAESMLGVTWDEVARKAGRHPRAAEGERLRRRAVAGAVGAARFDGREMHPERILALWQDLNSLTKVELLHDQQLRGAYLAAVEAVLEFVEGAVTVFGHLGQVREDLRRTIDVPAVLRLADVPAGERRDLRAFAAALAGRALALGGRRAEGLRRIEEEIDRRLGPGAGPEGWLDWRAPADVSARVRLEFVRLAYPALLPPAEVLERIGRSTPAASSADTDRLAGAILLLRGALAPPSDDFEDRSVADPPAAERPPCNAHAAFPRRLVAEAEALAGRGEVDRALGVLRGRSIKAEEAFETDGTLEDLGRAALRISRRMRLFDTDPVPYRRLLSSLNEEDQALLWALSGLDRFGLDPTARDDGVRSGPLEDRVASWHLRWRGVDALRREAALAAVRWAVDNGRPVRPGGGGPAALRFVDFSWLLDLKEADLVSRREGGPAAEPGQGLAPEDAAAWWGAHAEQPAEALPLLLRTQALALHPGRALPPTHAAVRLLGVRRAAEIALDEGELLALRLPDRAVGLLECAYDWFFLAEDITGEVLARACAVLCRARLGQRKQVEKGLKALRGRYNALRESKIEDTDVPLAWDQLKGLAAGPEGRGLDQLGPRGWKPWLIRIVACLAWEADRGRIGERCRRLASWLLANYGTRGSGGRVPLPVELNGWLWDGREGGESATAGGAPGEVADLAEVTVDIEPSRQTAEVGWAGGKVRAVLAHESDSGTVRVEVDVNGVAPYATALAFTPELPNWPERIARALAPGGALRLRVGEPLSAICWEGLLEATLVQFAPTSLRRLRCYRSAYGSGGKRTANWSQVERVLLLTNDPSQRDMAHEGWKRLGWKRLGEEPRLSVRYQDGLRGRDDLSDLASFRPQVLHLIGTPVETSVGVRFRLGRDEGSSKSSGSGQDVLLRPEELAQSLPDLSLCVLQAAPAPVLSRSGSDRERAGSLRRFASELLIRGVPAAVAVPPLPHDLAASVLGRIAAALLRRDVEALSTLLDAIAMAQEDVQGRLKTIDDVSRVEVTCDFCLFHAGSRKR